MFGTYRTLLALMVVALHLGGIPVIGAYAVFGFYSLSGYLMTFIMQNNYGYTSGGLYKYALNRFLRIYPIYWIALLFSVGLAWYLGSSFTSNYHPAFYLPEDLSELGKNFFLFFPFQERPRLAPPAWALTVELFFYILIGLGISKSRRRTLIWLGLSIVYHGLIIVFEMGWHQRYYTIPAASLPFATGALIYHFKRPFIHFTDQKLGRLGPFSAYIIFFVILVNWMFGYLTAQSEGVSFYLNYLLCAVMVVVLAEKRVLPYISRTFDRWMGDFSYPIYLIHYQVGLVVVILFGAVNVDLQRPNLILMSVSIPLIFLFSWMITVTVARPLESFRTRVKQAPIS